MTDASATESAAPHAVAARNLMRSLDRAALATVQRNAAGWPYPSLVLAALDHDGSPILLLSRLAEHTLNLLEDPRIGLLFDGTHALAEPLTGSRVSVLGRARRSDLPRHRARYLARHPGGGLYAGFSDFACYLIEVSRAHMVSGFGRIHKVEGDALIVPPAIAAGWTAGEAADEFDVLARLNRDHPPRGAAFATGSGASTEPWSITGLDPDGADLRRGGEIVRVPFDQPAASAEAAATAFMELASRR